MTDAGGPALTLAEAARAAGVDRGTLRRKLHAGEFSEAFKDAQGFWRIPADNLAAAGLDCTGPQTVISIAPNSEATVSEAASAAAMPDPPELEALRAEVATHRHRADKADALLAAERRLSEELRNALTLERHTVEVLLAQLTGERRDMPAPTVPQAGPRANWQAGLRAARARQLQERATRDRGTG